MEEGEEESFIEERLDDVELKETEAPVNESAEKEPEKQTTPKRDSKAISHTEQILDDIM
jgi:hypothetical protein